MSHESDTTHIGRLMRCTAAGTFASFYRMPFKAHIAAAAMMLLVAGCTLLPPKQDETRFIVLSSVAMADSNTSALTGGEKLAPIAIGLGPIHLPEYLDRPELVIRASPNSLDLSRTDRWAEPLIDNFRHVLANNLTGLLGAKNIMQFPWDPGTPLDFVVQVQVQRFEADTTRKAELIATWELRTGHNNQVLATRKAQMTQLSTSLAGDAVAAALSKAVAELAEQIASAIVQAEQQRVAGARR